MPAFPGSPNKMNDPFSFPLLSCFPVNPGATRRRGGRADGPARYVLFPLVRHTDCRSIISQPPFKCNPRGVVHSFFSRLYGKMYKSIGKYLLKIHHFLLTKGKRRTIIREKKQPSSWYARIFPATAQVLRFFLYISSRCRFHPGKDSVGNRHFESEKTAAVYTGGSAKEGTL